MGHTEGEVCRCVSEHRPAPLDLEVHHVWPMGMGGPDVKENEEPICPTTHTNVHILLRAMVKAGAVLTYSWFNSRYAQPLNRYAWELAKLGFERDQRGSL